MWVTVDTYHYNADNIVEFQWSMGKLYIWDNAPVTDNVIENVCAFDDPNMKEYKSLCKQLGVKPLKELEDKDD